ncbi:MAG: MMPL family transporter [Verrucomicrobiota bacterium]
MKFSRRWLWLLLLVPIAIGFARLRFDVEILNLLPEKSGIVQGLKLYQQNFSNGRELIITLRSDDAEKTETAARSLADAFRNATNLVADATWQPGWLEYPTQSAELVAFMWLNQPPEIFGELTNRLAPENLSATLTATKDRLASSLSPTDIAMGSYDPFNLMRLPESVSSAMPIGTGQELFSSADGKFRLVFVEANSNLASYRDCRKWLNSIKAIVAAEQSSAKFPKEINIQYTGRPAFVTEIAGGMESDMAGPSLWTLGIIALLFYITHRRWLPLLWLLVLLAIILAMTLAFGGLIFGTLSVVSLGFASILLGLAEDFGIVLYQESQSHPELSAEEIRRETRDGIFWSAVTTSGAFFLLNLSGLPGLGQLGSLVAIGIIIAAIVMQYAYLPPLMRSAKIIPKISQPEEEQKTDAENFLRFRKATSAVWLGTLVFLVGLIAVCLKFWPSFDQSPDALRPKNSQAYAAVEEIKHNLGGAQEPLWILTPGRDEAEVARRLQRVEAELRRAVSNEWISSYTLPLMLWPQPANQTTNRAALKNLLKGQEQLHDAALASGFTSNSLSLTKSLFQTWQSVASQTNIFWPTNKASRWILDKVVAKTPAGFVSVGLIYPGTNSSSETVSAKTKSLAVDLSRELEKDGVILSGWSLLGTSMFDLVKEDFPRVIIPILLLVTFSLWLAFRSVRELSLSLLTLVFSGLFLVMIMSIAGWTWNLMNMMAIPLLLGMGVDFSIHMQLALRRYRGNPKLIHKSIGRALLLAGSTTVAGFGSLIFSSNTGLSSLGKICATGIAIAMLTSVYLLPMWWRSTLGKNFGAVAPKKDV